MAIELKKKAKPPMPGGLRVGGNRSLMETERSERSESEEVFGAHEFVPADDDPEDEPLDGPSYDPEDDDDAEAPPSYEILPPTPRSAAPLSAMPLRKVPQSLKKPVPAATPTAKGAKATTERSRLSCELSRAHHRRMKIHAALEDKSIVSIIEEWIDEHCPPL